MHELARGRQTVPPCPMQSVRQLEGADDGVRQVGLGREGGAEAAQACHGTLESLARLAGAA